MRLYHIIFGCCYGIVSYNVIVHTVRTGFIYVFTKDASYLASSGKLRGVFWVSKNQTKSIHLAHMSYFYQQQHKGTTAQMPCDIVCTICTITYSIYYKPQQLRICHVLCSVCVVFLVLGECSVNSFLIKSNKGSISRSIIFRTSWDESWIFIDTAAKHFINAGGLVAVMSKLPSSMYSFPILQGHILVPCKRKQCLREL